MTFIRYESILVEQALTGAYAKEAERCLKKAGGLNDLKGLARGFEKDFARYIGVHHAIAVNSGSDALAMSLRAAGIGKGDEVIIPDLTYQAVALAVVYRGAVPGPVDALPGDLTMDPGLVARAMSRRTKAVIAAHMFGRPCDMEALRVVCRKKGIALIEDVCQAESSSLNGRMLGSYGDLAVFSFSYYKPLSSCAGGGGMVVFNDPQYVKMGRWQEDWRDDPELLLLGQRFAPLSFMDLIALRVKFGRREEIISSRKKIKELYEKGLQKVPGLTIFTDRPGADSVPQNFVVCCDKRDALAEFLQHHGVSVQKAYRPLHLMSAYRFRGKKKFPVSDDYAARALHLPLYSFMSPQKAGAVITLCRRFFGQKTA